MARNGATRKKLLILTLGLALGVGTVTPAFATSIGCGTACSALITIGTEKFPVTVTVGKDGVGRVTNVTVRATDGSSATIQSLTLNPDPSIVFANAAIAGPSGPEAFHFLYQTNISLSGPINASSAIAYVMTDGSTPLDAVGLSPTSGTVLVANDFDSSFPPIKINKGVDVGPACAGPGTVLCGPFTKTSTFFLDHTFTLMTVDIGFVLTKNDAAAFTGRVDQVVPEPDTLLLMGSGLLGLAGWRRYFSRT